MVDMTQEEVARMLWEVDQRIAFGHVKAPWATATARPAAYARKRAEQILDQGFRVLQPADPSPTATASGLECAVDAPTQNQQDRTQEEQ